MRFPKGAHLPKRAQAPLPLAAVFVQQDRHGENAAGVFARGGVGDLHAAAVLVNRAFDVFKAVPAVASVFKGGRGLSRHFP